MEKPIFDPPVPYVGPIYNGRFSPGKIIRIQGSTSSIANRFNITVQCGPVTLPRDDVALQISVRLLDGYISLNSLQNGIWGKEQRESTLPIKRFEKFEITVTCDFNQYKVAINGRHYCAFPQRIHYNSITHLAIDGDVSVSQISYESGAYTPTLGAESNIFETVPLSNDSIMKNNQDRPVSWLLEAPLVDASYPNRKPIYPTSNPTHPQVPLNTISYPTSVTNGSRYPQPSAPLAGAPTLFNAVQNDVKSSDSEEYSPTLKSVLICLASVLVVIAVIIIFARNY